MPSRRVSTGAIEKIFEMRDAFAAGPDADRAFLDAVTEAAEYHFRNSDLYRNICRDSGYRPGPFASLDDLSGLPWVFVDVFKHHRLLSVPEKDVVFTFTSSGTGGTKSQIMWDEVSQERQTLMRIRTMETLGLVSKEPARYAIFSYDFAQSEGRGAAYAHEMYSTFAPPIEKWYALRIRERGGDFSFDLNESAETLERMAASGDPVRILGFPSFVYFTVEEISKRRETLPLDPRSVVINGGGWKLHTGREIEKGRYRREVARFFGIPEKNITDVFGMVEHGVPYISCSQGNFHEPIYSRILVRPPLSRQASFSGDVPPSREVLALGEVGLLQFITPYIRSMPTLSLLSSDLGFIGEKCPCGIARPWFKVLRRGGTRLYKGCALTASELIRQ
jgi:phenylacetate-coenzyme A ligase PaaK-like adenylate-forming protein